MSEILKILAIAFVLGGAFWTLLFGIAKLADWIYSPHDFRRWWKRNGR